MLHLRSPVPEVAVTPDKIFIGNLAPGSKSQINFTVTPELETPLVIAVTYNNGNNPHKVRIYLPITFGIDKMEANPVISNVQIRSESGIYHVTGDVNNAGLETANTVMVTSLSPAVPQDPYKTYVVGALKPDDFGASRLPSLLTALLLSRSNFLIRIPMGTCTLLYRM